MKSFLITTIFFASIPVFATCSLDKDSLSCSMAQFQKPMDMTYSTTDSIKEYSATPEARLRPTRNQAGEKILREFGPTTRDFNYNADCQFGVCYDKGGDALFLQGGRRW